MKVFITKEKNKHHPHVKNFTYLRKSSRKPKSIYTEVCCNRTLIKIKNRNKINITNGKELVLLSKEQYIGRREKVKSREQEKTF